MSVKLTIKLSPADAERLYWAVQSGELDDLGVLSCEYVPQPQEAPSTPSGDEPCPNASDPSR